jgi:diguanylate cyclase (GGDEF)-like protein
MEDKKNILIVEDNQDLMTLLKKYLTEQQFNIIEAENAETGLEKFDKQHPDLVLMDLMLPGMSGLEAIEHIKQKQTNDSYIPVLIITAKNEVNDIIEGLETGADDYIVKPFHLDELTARINTALRLKNLNDLLVKQSKQLEDANKQISRLNQSLIGKNKELKKEIYNLHNLFEISNELHSILDLQRLVNSTLLTLVGQFSCKSALFLYTLKQNKSYLEVIKTKGLYQKDVEGFTLDRKDMLFSYFESHPFPTLIKDLKKIIGKSTALKKLSDLKIEIITPVIIQNSIEGLICLGSRVKNKIYHERELEHISILSNIISIAVANASLYLEVEQLSYTDGMTDLHNFRYFELRLKEEVVRHKRSNSGLSLLILDVDNFKNFNDTIGHQAGDEVLRKLAHIIRDTSRENDIVSRYGGEEFAVILPGIDRKGASVLAERIREKIENTYFSHEEIQPIGKITVSIGSASMPDDAYDYKDLIYKSDTALFTAKRNGRNQIQAFHTGMII